jgi:hypothetical protein
MRGDSIEFVRRGTRAGTVQMQSNGSRSWDDFWRDDLYVAICLDAACPRVGQAELSADSTVKQAFCRELSRAALYIKRCSTERWHTDHRQTWVDDSCFVVLNHGELYSQGLRPVQVRAFRGTSLLVCVWDLLVDGELAVLGIRLSGATGKKNWNR